MATSRILSGRKFGSCVIVKGKDDMNWSDLIRERSPNSDLAQQSPTGQRDTVLQGFDPGSYELG